MMSFYPPICPLSIVLNLSDLYLVCGVIKIFSLFHIARGTNC